MSELLETIDKFRKFELEYNSWAETHTKTYREASERRWEEENKAIALNLLLTDGLRKAKEEMQALSLQNKNVESKYRDLSTEFISKIELAIKNEEMIPAYACRFYVAYCENLRCEHE